jgi:hypothetical protein
MRCVAAICLASAIALIDAHGQPNFDLLPTCGSKSDLSEQIRKLTARFDELAVLLPEIPEFYERWLQAEYEAASMQETSTRMNSLKQQPHFYSFVFKYSHADLRIKLTTAAAAGTEKERIATLVDFLARYPLLRVRADDFLREIEQSKQPDGRDRNDISKTRYELGVFPFAVSKTVVCVLG